MIRYSFEICLIFLTYLITHESCSVLEKYEESSQKHLFDTVFREKREYVSSCDYFNKMNGITCSSGFLEYDIDLLFYNYTYVPAGMLTGYNISRLIFESFNLTVAEDFLEGVCYLSSFRVKRSSIEVKYLLRIFNICIIFIVTMY